MFAFFWVFSATMALGVFLIASIYRGTPFGRYQKPALAYGIVSFFAYVGGCIFANRMEPLEVEQAFPLHSIVQLLTSFDRTLSPMEIQLVSVQYGGLLLFAALPAVLLYAALELYRVRSLSPTVQEHEA